MLYPTQLGAVEYRAAYSHALMQHAIVRCYRPSSDEPCSKGGGRRRRLLTPLVDIYRCVVGRFKPLRCALRFWLWAVWFLDLDMLNLRNPKRSRSVGII